MVFEKSLPLMQVSYFSSAEEEGVDFPRFLLWIQTALLPVEDHICDPENSVFSRKPRGRKDMEYVAWEWDKS